MEHSRAAKVERFRALHTASKTFVIANAWTVGTAKQLAALGFEAIATTSAGIAMDVGLDDGQAGRGRTLAVGAAIASAVDLPVSADLENCFADEPEGCADTIRAAIDLGLAGGSIEDFTGRPDDPIYAFDEAVDRVRAAVSAGHDEGRDFVLTARAENFLHGRPDIDDTINRLKAFEQAGADVLFAPGLPDLDSVRAVRAAITKPINVLMSGPANFSVDDLVEAGIERISLGPRLARAAERAVIAAALEFRP